jgi:DNA polymerase V
MDIVAKHTDADEDGARIAALDEMSYRRTLWNHRPITDFWRVGKGYGKKLEENRIFTMGDVARTSLTEYGEDKLYRLFGVNAELLIDHAWGFEPCTMEDIRNYTPQSKSIGSGQVLHCPYTYEKARLIVKEMTELLVLDLVDKKLATNQIVLTIGYDVENLSDGGGYQGEVITDRYGRKVPKYAHGTQNLSGHTSSTKLIMDNVLKLYDNITDKGLLVRRVNISVNNVVPEDEAYCIRVYEQLDLFTDYEQEEQKRKQERLELKKEKSIQNAIINIKKKYGKNAVLKGMNLEEGATAKARNGQIGGHQA